MAEEEWLTQNSTMYYDLDVGPPDVTLFEFWTEGVVLTLTGLAGMCGNALSLAILSRREMRSPVSFGLLTLALFDTALLLSSIAMLGLHKLGYRWMFLHRYTFEAYPFVVQVAYPIGLIAQTGSVWTTVGVTVERWVAVRHPLRARALCTHRRAQCVCVAIALFSVAYNVPRFWEVDVVRSADGVYVAKPSEFRMDKVYYQVYYIWLYLFVMYFVPFLTLAVLNVSIWRAVRHAGHHRSALTRREEKEISLATMLVCVVAVFFLCNILAMLCNILELFELYIPSLVRVSNLLVTLNSSVNFVVYCIFGEKFRRMFIDMCFCGRGRGRGRAKSFTSTLHATHTETLKDTPSPLKRTPLPNGTGTSNL